MEVGFWSIGGISRQKMIIETATIYAFVTLFFTLLWVLVHFLIFFGIFWVIGWGILKVLRPIVLIIKKPYVNTEI